MSMHNAAVTPLLTHWSYQSFALSNSYESFPAQSGCPQPTLLSAVPGHVGPALVWLQVRSLHCDHRPASTVGTPGHCWVLMGARRPRTSHWPPCLLLWAGWCPWQKGQSGQALHLSSANNQYNGVKPPYEYNPWNRHRATKWTQHLGQKDGRRDRQSETNIPHNFIVCGITIPEGQNWPRLKSRHSPWKFDTWALWVDMILYWNMTEKKRQKFNHMTTC